MLFQLNFFKLYLFIWGYINRSDKAPPLLRELHWFPVKQRIDYKTLLICFKARNSLAPEYLTTLLSSYSRPNNLRTPSENSLTGRP